MENIISQKQIWPFFIILLYSTYNLVQNVTI